MSVFSRARKDLVLTVLAAAGAVGALAACSSDEATYRAQPQSTSGSRSCGGTTTPGARSCGGSQPTYTQPSQPTYTQPTQPAPRPGGQMSCGKGKCG
jgi:hypothetical protein